MEKKWGKNEKKWEENEKKWEKNEKNGGKLIFIGKMVIL
jgi:hypothetical protein